MNTNFEEIRLSLCPTKMVHISPGRMDQNRTWFPFLSPQNTHTSIDIIPECTVVYGLFSTNIRKCNKQYIEHINIY